MARQSLTFVCQNCGAVYGRWQGKCEILRRVEHDRRGKRSRAAARAGPPDSQGPAIRPRIACRRYRRDATARIRSVGTRPGHRRRAGARLGPAGRRRSGHRQIDAADPGRRSPRAGGPPRGLYLGRRSGGAGAAARRAARPRPGAGGAGRRDVGGGHHRHPVGRRHAATDRHRIRSRPCGRTPWNRRPAP